MIAYGTFRQLSELQEDLRHVGRRLSRDEQRGKEPRREGREAHVSGRMVWCPACEHEECPQKRDCGAGVGVRFL